MGGFLPNTLAAMVREKLHAGALPLDQPLKVWAGIGGGEPCTVCEKPILGAQTQYEAEYYDERPAFRFHVGCHGLWEDERRRRTSPQFRPGKRSPK
jgi:hypothetical protein